MIMHKGNVMKERLDRKKNITMSIKDNREISRKTYISIFMLLQIGNFLAILKCLLHWDIAGVYIKCERYFVTQLPFYKCIRPRTGN